MNKEVRGTAISTGTWLVYEYSQDPPRTKTRNPHQDPETTSQKLLWLRGWDLHSVRAEDVAGSEGAGLS